MTSTQLIIIIRAILKLLFSNFKTFLRFESYLFSDFENLNEKINSIQTIEDLESFKKDLTDFFETYSYFFEINIIEERKEIKDLIIGIERLTHELSNEIRLFKDKLKEFEANLEKIKDLKDVNKIIGIIQNEIKSVIKFLDFFNEEINNLKEKIKKITEKVSKFDKKIFNLQKKAFIDELTKVYNRRGLEIKLRHYLNDFVFGKDNFALIFFDIDNFKEINDTYGHVVGDLILKKIAEIMKKSVRAEDLIARYGGDEFIVAVFQVEKSIAYGIAKRIIGRIIHGKFKYDDKEIKVKISGGMYYVEKQEPLEEIIKKADKAMYEAKNSKEKIKIYC